MRMRTWAVIAAAGLSGCAANKSSTAAVVDLVPSGAIQYEGQFRPVQQNTGQMGMQTSQRIFGSARVIYREATGRAQAFLEINTSASQSDLLTWSIASGRCNSGSVPLAPVSQFPTIELSSNGRGEVTASDLPLVMPRSSYHVNVYRGGETLANVIACANLSVRSGA